MGAHNKPLLIIVKGSDESTSGRNPSASVRFNLLRYEGKELDLTILGEVEGAKLTYIAPVDHPAHGSGHRYRLEVEGSTSRLKLVQELIAATVEGNRAQREKLIQSLRNK